MTVVSWSSPDLTVLEDVTDYDIATATPTASPDYICQAGATVYPPIPKTMAPALIRLTLAKALRATGDPRAAEAEDEGQRELQTAVRVLTPRDDRRSRATVGDSPLRATRGGGWRWPR